MSILYEYDINVFQFHLIKAAGHCDGDDILNHTVAYSDHILHCKSYERQLPYKSISYLINWYISLIKVI